MKNLALIALILINRPSIASAKELSDAEMSLVKATIEQMMGAKVLEMDISASEMLPFGPLHREVHAYVDRNKLVVNCQIGHVFVETGEVLLNLCSIYESDSDLIGRIHFPSQKNSQ